MNIRITVNSICGQYDGKKFLFGPSLAKAHIGNLKTVSDLDIDKNRENKIR